MGDPEQKVPQHDAPASVGQPSGAVFLSYGSEDAAAAERIATTLSRAGIQVWFDKSELRGGDAWDRHIRQQIHDCRLFIAVISAHTEARDEGYFRREWRLAVERAGDMAEGKAFLVPVVIDGTTERGASVPDKFRELQWTRLPGGETPPAFVQRVQRLLSPGPPTTGQPATGGVATAPASRDLSRAFWWLKPATLAVVAVLGLALAYLIAEKFWNPRHVTEAPPATSAAPTPAATTTAAAFNPPPHSIAVLPFVNMSGDKDQDYFSDGLTEELLNSLAEISELQVAARTSAFSFKGKDTDIGTIARKLNVGAVLEGSVRRSGNTVRITTQLINAVTGFHLWSHAYDRDLTDVLRLQTEIAGAVANALKVSLLGDATTKIELGGTRNPAAFDAYLRASKLINAPHDSQDVQAAVAAFSEAIHLDPSYALALAGRSLALARFAMTYAPESSIQESLGAAFADARQATALAPDLAEGHLAAGRVLLAQSLDLVHADQEYERAAALGQGNARVLSTSGRYAVLMGRKDAGIAAVQRALVLDPLNPATHAALGDVLYWARRYSEAMASYRDALVLDPDYSGGHGMLGLTYYSLGDLQNARSSCEDKPDQHWATQLCLAVAFHRLGRQAEAEASLAKLRADNGNSAAYQYALIYAQWGDVARGLKWLDTAVRVHDPGVTWLKVDPLLDPLRQEPRFQAIERELKFPE